MIETKIQMRFADVDMLGHVNNVNQQHYFDLGKSDFFRRVLGMKPVWKSEGLIMVSTRTDYRGQIRMEDPIVVTTCVDRNKDTARAKPLPYPTGIPGSAHFIPRKRSSLHNPGTES